MKRSNHYLETFETQDLRQDRAGTVQMRKGFAFFRIKAAVLVSLLAASLTWYSALTVRAEEETEAEETESEETEAKGSETEAQLEDYIRSFLRENGTRSDQGIAEELEDYISSFLKKNGTGSDQSIAEELEDYISSFLKENGIENSQSIAEELGDYIRSFLKENGTENSQSILEELEDYISSFLEENGTENSQSIAEQLEDYISSFLAEETEDTDRVGNAADLVADIPTTQYFTDEPVAEEDVEAILTAGINSPSAMNSQPWHFSAVTDTDLLQQIADDMSAGMASGAVITKAGIADAPLAIVISCAEGSELDAGLACQTMSIEAQLLGYGSKIISSPTAVLNGDDQEEYRELLGIPEDYSVVAVLLVGYEDTSVDESVDGYTSATTRNSMDEMVTYVEP